jgi:hypothetical protein
MVPPGFIHIESVEVEALIVSGKSASPNAEFEPSLGDMVDRRDVLGQAQGVAQGRT